MNVQSLITMGIVLAACLYVGRYFLQSVRSLWETKADGCGGGCANCAFAEKPQKAKRKAGISANMPSSAPASGFVAISDLQVLPRRRKSGSFGDTQVRPGTESTRQEKTGGLQTQVHVE